MTISTGTSVTPHDLATRLQDQADLDPVLDRIGQARVVCIGEASHGTHEFYEWRDLLTRRLIEEKGFDFVGVEGDWPDCYAVHRSVVAGASRRKTLGTRSAASRDGRRGCGPTKRSSRSPGGCAD